MKMPAIALMGLTALFVFAGVKGVSESERQNVGIWIGSFLPAVLTLYMAIRVWRDEPTA